MHGMFSTRPPFLAFSAIALSLGLVSSWASASPLSHETRAPRRTSRITDAEPSREDHDAAGSHACHRAKLPVEIVSRAESAIFSLETCDGTPIPASVDKLSIMARPTTVSKPKDLSVAGKGRGSEVAPGIRRLDPRLAERLEAVADHFRKDGETPRLVLVVGSRSAGTRSYHASGRALDFRVDGADNEAVAAFCKTVADTGCGFYPNSGFVHIDVRDPGTGHVAWIDVSKAGEAPKYVTSWPLPDAPTKSEPPKVEAPKEAENTEATQLPSLPAAMQVAPLESPKPETVPGDVPVKKRHHHRRWHRADHTI